MVRCFLILGICLMGGALVAGLTSCNKPPEANTNKPVKQDALIDTVARLFVVLSGLKCARF